ncbi:MAG: response regulator [Verrucomicrobiia bacterium]
MANILLLGADEATVSQYRNLFEHIGIAVASAEIVEPVEDLLRLAKPSAILLDLSRTRQDGVRLIRAIRSQAEFKTLPVYAITDAAAVGSHGLDAVEGVTASFGNDSAGIPRNVATIAGALGADEIAADSRPVDPLDASAQTGSSIEDADSLIPQLKETFRLFCSAENGTRLGLLTRMQEQVRNLRRSFLAADARALTAFSSALAKLFMTLAKDVARVNASSLRTLSTAIDVLAISATSHRNDVETGPVRVLIVDDEHLSRHALRFALGSPDLEVFECDSLERALQFLQRMEYDVVFADFKMVRSGDFSAQVRKLPNGASLPIVIVTSSSPDFEVRVQSALSGGCDLIAKPFTPSEMVVKAFTSALQRRLGRSPAGPAVNPPSPSPVFPPTGLRRNGTPPMLPTKMAPGTDTTAPITAVRFAEPERQPVAVAPIEERSRDVVTAAAMEAAPSGSSLEGLSPPQACPIPMITSEVTPFVPSLGGRPPAHEPSPTPSPSPVPRPDQLSDANYPAPIPLHTAPPASAPTMTTSTNSSTPALSPAPTSTPAAAPALSPVSAPAPAGAPAATPPIHATASPSPAPAPPPSPSQSPPPAVTMDANLREKFEEGTVCRALNDELARVRSVLQSERARRQEIEKTMSDLQDTREELAAKLESARQREAAQKDRLHALQASLEEATAKLTSTESALHGQAREVRRLQLRSKDLEEQVADLTSQVSTQLTVEEARRRREAEFEASFLNQQAEIAKAKASLAADQAQVQRARDRMQSALKLVLQELNGQE